MMARAYEPRDKEIWKILAFLGRYAHQPIKDLLGMPMSDLVNLAMQTTKFIEEEAEASKSAAQKWD